MLTVWVWEPETVEENFPEKVVDRVVAYAGRFRLNALK
jgi:hypothetical protein